MVDDTVSHKALAAVHYFKGMVGSVAETWFVKFGIKLSTSEEKNEYGQCLNLVADWHPVLPIEQVQIRPDVMDAIDTPRWSEIVAKAFELLMEKVQRKRLKQFQERVELSQVKNELVGGL